MMKQTIYILIKDCVEDYDREFAVIPYGELDEAVGQFKNLADSYRAAAVDMDWIIDEDTPHQFFAYEEGYENQNHFDIRLQISKINTKEHDPQSMV